MRKKIMKIMTTLSAVYDKVLTEQVLYAYNEVLDVYSDEQLECAMKEILRTNVYASMPKPAEFVRAIEQSPENTALLAWVTVYRTIKNYGAYKSIEFDDQYIHQAIDSMGGWQIVARHTDDETPFLEKRFISIYTAIAKRRLEDKPRLLGFFDITNKRYVDVVKVPCGYLCNKQLQISNT